MLAVGPAWHPLPFPSSPCLALASRQHVPSAPACPSARPPPSTGTAKRIRIKRETCFSARLLLRPNDITSAASSPKDSSRPAHFSLFAVDPPFYLNSTILYLPRQASLKCLIYFYVYLFFFDACFREHVSRVPTSGPACYRDTG